jgi:hypothetical protein
MKKHPSSRQVRYAYGLIDGDKTKQQIALDAGFSPSTARVPKSIENKVGFNIAMSQVHGELGNTIMQIIYEIKARGLKQMDNKMLIKTLEVTSKNYERFMPKVY